MSAWSCLRYAACTRSSTSALLLKNALQRQRRTLPPQLYLLPRKPHLVTATVILAAIDAELILLHTPFAVALAAHGVAGETSVGRKEVSPVRLVGDFHSGDLRLNLRAGELLEFFGRLDR